MTTTYAILYLDSARRIKFYSAGGYEYEVKVAGIGWTIEDADVTWDDAMEAMINFRNHLTNNVRNFNAVTA